MTYAYYMDIVRWGVNKDSRFLGSNLGTFQASFLGSLEPSFQGTVNRGYLFLLAVGPLDDEAIDSLSAEVFDEAMRAETDEIVLGHLNPVPTLEFVFHILYRPQLLLGKGVGVALIRRLRAYPVRRES